MTASGTTIAAFAALAVGGHPAPAPKEPPRVVEIRPAADAEVPAGKLTIRVTFDQPMRPGGFSYIMHDLESFPACAPTPTQSPDGRTFILDCQVKAGRTYWIGFNNAAHRNFTSVEGVPAVPALLRFSAR
jgi:hypothetical protein